MKYQVRAKDRVPIDEVAVRWVARGYEIKRTPVSDFKSAIRAAKESEQRWVLR